MRIIETRCKIRRDLLDSDLSVPTKTGVYLSGPDEFRVVKCNEYDTDSYNMTIMDSDGIFYRVYSIDFDFYNTNDMMDKIKILKLAKKSYNKRYDDLEMYDNNYYGLGFCEGQAEAYLDVYFNGTLKSGPPRFKIAHFINNWLDNWGYKE